MNRTSKISTNHDEAGDYEVEVFAAINPKGVIVCSHGNGVRRWDGERFFYNLAEHYSDYVVVLVDQNQPYEDGCKLNDLQIMVDRVQEQIAAAKAAYPDVPLFVVAHSMGCGVAARLALEEVSKMIFVAPTAGDQTVKLEARYGKEVLDGMVVQTSDGLTKFVTKEFVDSVQGIVWEQEYAKLLARFPEVYVFESGEEEIVGDERLAHRTMPFAGYKIVPGAKHNVSGEALKRLFSDLDTLI